MIKTSKDTSPEIAHDIKDSVTSKIFQSLRKMHVQNEFVYIKH